MEPWHLIAGGVVVFAAWMLVAFGLKLWRLEWWGR